MEKTFDLAVIGGGVAGISAAIRAAQNGLKVCIIEKDKIGGVHVNWGGIPTKALISGVEIKKRVRDGKKLGVNGNVNVDWGALQKHRVMVSSQVLRFNEMALKKFGIEIMHGRGEIDSVREVRIWREKEETVIHAENILIATGSESVSIPGIPFGSRILNSDEALQLVKIPKSILVIGGGAVGLEFATIFNLLGSKVIVVELLPRLLPNEEPDVGEFIEKKLEKEGIRVLVGSKVVDVKPTEKNVEVAIETPEGRNTEEVEKVLMAIGRRPNIDAEKLEGLGIKTTKKGIVVNERMQTSIPNVYAAGDVVGKHLLLNVAMKEGKTAADNMIGKHKAMEYTAVPRCVFTLPEVAAVGLTEEQARKENADVIVVKDPFFSPRAAGAGEAEGFIKIVCNSEGMIVGATIVGSHVSEMIFPLSMALHKRISAFELAEMFYPSPTFIEVVMNAVGKVVGKAIFGIR
jgi:dihydrolipoamide dehydrogenase